MLGIYIHFPFCEKKCNYCAFASFANLNEQDNYVTHLINEIDNFCSSHQQENMIEVDTIYIGGGTPSLISEKNLTRLINKLKNKFKIEKKCEITIECNPNSVTMQKLQLYKEIGINRISFGVQSLNDDELKFLGRLHCAQQAIETIKMAQAVGFDNISCDLIIGAKGQDEESFLQSVKKLVDLGVEHLSCYMLQVEEGTPLKKMVESNADLLPSDDECVNIYSQAINCLTKEGYSQYEVSNFAKNGKISKHNYKYWTGENYVGFGLGAHSYINNTRIANASTFEEYYKGMAEKEVLNKTQLIEEHIMLGLRCSNGVSLSHLKNLGYDIEKNDNLKPFLEQGILTSQGDKIFINPAFYGVCNYVIVKLLP